MDAGQQFADAEGLGDVIIRAEVQSDDFVDFLAFGGEHQDGRRDFFGAELFADVVTARAGQHDIQDDQGRWCLATLRGLGRRGCRTVTSKPSLFRTSSRPSRMWGSSSTMRIRVFIGVADFHRRVAQKLQ